MVAACLTSPALQVEPLDVELKNSRRIAELTIPRHSVAGFQILIRHGEGGPLSQVRLVRVSSSADRDKEPLPLGRFLVPLVHSPTLLSFYFSAPLPLERICFEYLSTYGAKPEHFTAPKVYVFTTAAATAAAGAPEKP